MLYSSIWDRGRQDELERKSKSTRTLYTWKGQSYGNGGIMEREREIDNKGSHFDLGLSVEENEGGVKGKVEISGKYFKGKSRGKG